MFPFFKFYLQGVPGSRVVCCRRFCHLLHGAGEKHPLSSPAGKKVFLSTPQIISSGNVIRTSGQRIMQIHSHWYQRIVNWSKIPFMWIFWKLFVVAKGQRKTKNIHSLAIRSFYFGIIKIWIQFHISPTFAWYLIRSWFFVGLSLNSTF